MVFTIYAAPMAVQGPIHHLPKGKGTLVPYLNGVNDGEPSSHGWAGLVRVLLSPLLNVVQLSAATTNGVLTGRVEASGAVASVGQQTHKGLGDLALPLVGSPQCLVSLGDDRDGRLPDVRTEQCPQSVCVSLCPVSLVDTVIEEWGASSSAEEFFATLGHLGQRQLLLERD